MIRSHRVRLAVGRRDHKAVDIREEVDTQEVVAPEIREEGVDGQEAGAVDAPEEVEFDLTFDKEVKKKGCNLQPSLISIQAMSTMTAQRG